MLQTFRNAWRIEELRKKILFTLLIVLLYRLGNAVPVPFVDTKALAEYFQSSGLQNTILGLFNVMSGGAFSQATIFALSIQPYINASIIIKAFYFATKTIGKEIIFPECYKPLFHLLILRRNNICIIKATPVF